MDSSITRVASERDSNSKSFILRGEERSLGEEATRLGKDHLRFGLVRDKVALRNLGVRRPGVLLAMVALGMSAGIAVCLFDDLSVLALLLEDGEELRKVDGMVGGEVEHAVVKGELSRRGFSLTNFEHQLSHLTGDERSVALLVTVLEDDLPGRGLLLREADVEASGDLRGLKTVEEEGLELEEHRLDGIDGRPA